MSNTEKVSIVYNVLDVNAEIIREGRISGTFSEDSAMVDIVDELLERAYEREMMGTYWESNYQILEA
tara:strand:- start:7855 stop:8055 length:201 start_codon:yes stop_codon:yes gene_type:complete